MIRIEVKHLLLLVFIGFGASAEAAQDDRKKDYDDSRDQARKTNQQNLQPNMMQHLGKAMEHMKKAQDARQQQDEGKAKEEEQKAMMEQGKAQQLNQQMQANEKSAKQNDDASKLLQKMDTAAPMKVPTAGQDINVITVRDPAKKATADNAKVDLEPVPPIPKAELVNLAQTTYVPASIKPPSSPVSPEPERSRYGYDESLPVAKAAPAGGSMPDTSSQTTSTAKAETPATTTATSTTMLSSSSGFAAPPSTSKGSDSAGDFWNNVGEKVTADNRVYVDKNERLNMKNLRGATEKKSVDDKEALPGKELSDTAFWKKVGKEPAKCKAGSGYQRDKCLKSTRREYERKWREARAAKKVTS